MDEARNLCVGDTYNRVARMVDRAIGRIVTIAVKDSANAAGLLAAESTSAKEVPC